MVTPVTLFVALDDAVTTLGLQNLAVIQYWLIIGNKDLANFVSNSCSERKTLSLPKSNNLMFLETRESDETSKCRRTQVEELENSRRGL